MNYRKKVKQAWEAFQARRPHVGWRREFMTIGELCAFDRPTPTHGDTWGNWRYDARTMVVRHRLWNYEVDLESCTTSARTLDYIFQVASKTWATAKDLGDLVQAIDDLLDPQAHLCSFGMDTRFNPTAHLEELAARAKAEAPAVN